MLPYPKARTTPAKSSPLPAKTSKTTSATMPAFSTKNAGSRSIPTETKNSMVKTSLKGSTSASAWWL
jgi:hypothetical protein